MTGDAGVPVGRIQWSKIGITIYDLDGSFICRLEDMRDRNFLAAVIGQALKKISYEQAKRSAFAADGAANEPEPDVAPI